MKIDNLLHFTVAKVDCNLSFSNGGKCGMMSEERRNSCETNTMCPAGPLSALGADGLPDGKNAGGNIPAYANAGLGGYH